MIVVDVNVLAYLLIPGKYTALADQVLQADAEWAAPRLWRSEFRNILANYLRLKLMDLDDANALFKQAADLIAAEEFEVHTVDVLRLSKLSTCTAYDCEYVALAEFLGLPLVTADVKVAKAFPQHVRLLAPA